MSSKENYCDMQQYKYTSNIIFARKPETRECILKKQAKLIYKVKRLLTNVLEMLYLLI